MDAANTLHALTVDSVVLGYNDRNIVKDLSFNLARGDIGCLLGGSGCGKTTLLRAIAGFERLSAGRIGLNGQWASTTAAHVPPQDRQIGMVFQDYALFPHLNIADNIGFGLSKLSAQEKRTRVADMLTLVGLKQVERRYPHELSGGQQQRVALARALAPRPALLLMDEPFSNLDVALRERLSVDVHGILKATHTSGLLVTHNQQEAFAMADRVGVMQDGQLQQWGSPRALYQQPASRYIATFVGDGVFLPARVQGGNRVDFELGQGCHILPIQAAENTCVDVLIRPEDIAPDDNSPLRAKVISRVFRGAAFLYTLELASGNRLLSLVASHHDYRIGDMLGVRLAVNTLVAFMQETV